jgi:hypothetical protein
VLTANLGAIANLERLLVVQATRREYPLAAPKFIAIVDPTHRRSARYAPRTLESLVARRRSTRVLHN